MKRQIQDCRKFNPTAVQIANQLGSARSEDYRVVEAWLVKTGYDFNVDVLVDLFDREVGEENLVGAT